VLSPATSQHKAAPTVKAALIRGLTPANLFFALFEKKFNGGIDLASVPA
jgi:hypothetical protein